MSYYLENTQFIEILRDFFFDKRKVHLGIAKRLEVGTTVDGLRYAVGSYLSDWIRLNPNGLKFYANRIKDSEKPKISSEINEEFISNLVEILVGHFDKFDDMYEVINAESAKREAIHKSQMEYDALSDSEKEERQNQKIVSYLDHWSKKSHSVN